MDSDGVEQAHRFKPGGCEIVKWISISQLLHIGCLLLSPGVSNLKVFALNKTKQVKCTKQLLCDGSQQAYRDLSSLPHPKYPKHIDSNMQAAPRG